MVNSFEDAMHQGFSASEMADEMRELRERCQNLGCETCMYRNMAHPTCYRIIKNEDLEKCPYYKEG